MKSCVLFSGGLDSLCAWHALGRPDAVYVQLGHRYQPAEIEAMRALSRRVHGLRVRGLPGPDIGRLEEPNGFIPARNLVLALTAALNGYDVIYLAALRGESSPDKDRRFERDTTSLLSRCMGRRVRLSLPLLRMTKTQLVRVYLAAVGDEEALRLTHSCYAGGAIGCGRCMACFRRWVAMSNNGIEEEYAVPPATVFGGATKRDAWQHLRRAGVRRWPDIVRNNLDAARAVRRFRCT